MQVRRIGNEGENMDSFTAQLFLYMEQDVWASMTVAEVTVLYWLKDLDASDKHHEELGNLINRLWIVLKLKRLLSQSRILPRLVASIGRVSDKTN